MAEFLFAYAAVLASPGPNVFLVAGCAAVRGYRGALPLCLSIALRTGTLSAAALLAASAVSDWGAWAGALRLASVVLLVAVAVTVIRLPRPGAAPGERQGTTVAAGFCTAATNPVSAAFFTAQFLGPFGASASAVLAPPCVAALVLAYMAGVAGLLAHSSTRRLALAWHGPIKTVAALALVATAAVTAVDWP